MLLGGVCSKSTFSNYFFFLQEEFFETNLDLSKHPQQVFWIFFSFTKYLFSIFVFIRVIGELRELCAKFWNFGVNIHGEIICQSRLLLNPFYSGPIVHWLNANYQKSIRLKFCRRSPPEFLRSFFKYDALMLLM